MTPDSSEPERMALARGEARVIRTSGLGHSREDQNWHQETHRRLERLVRQDLAG
jgi:hypothetical protein